MMTSRIGRTVHRWLLLLLWFALMSCASSQGFDRDALRSSLHHDPEVVTERDISGVLTLKPQLPSPYKLGVYLKRLEFPSLHGRQPANWTSEDKEILRDSLNLLKIEGVVSDVFFLADSTIQGGSLRDVRLAAARYGCDAILIVQGASAVDRYNNNYALLYPTIVGAYLAPGTHSDALFLVEGTLWDVRNEYLYATQELEGESQSVGPAALLRDIDTVAQAKKAAIDRFAFRMRDQLRRVSGKP